MRLLRAGAKIHSGAHPLGEVICFFIPYARRGFQHLIRNVVQEVFFILVGHVIHTIDAHDHAFAMEGGGGLQSASFFPLQAYHLSNISLSPLLPPRRHCLSIKTYTSIGARVFRSSD